MAMRSRGNERMADIIEKLDDVSKLEMDPRMNGRRMSMVLAPDKQKIATYKRKLEKEGKTLASQTETTAAEQAAVDATDTADTAATVEPTSED